MSENSTINSELLVNATQGRMIWLRFKKHKIAVFCSILLFILYIISLFAEFFIPYSKEKRFPGYENTQPTKVYLFNDRNDFIGPHFFSLKKSVNNETFEVEYTEDKNKINHIKFLSSVETYKLIGLISLNIKLFSSEKPFFMFGSDRLGRDVYSRTIIGMRISLFVGLGGVIFSFFLGCVLGGVSGYFGGYIDGIVQRMIDVLLSIPTIPLWMALAAAIPRDWSVIQTYFAITMVLAVVGWAGLARVVRGKILALREEDFVMAAQISGVKESKIITSHLLPNFFSYLVVHLTLAVPSTILGETALSFLGLGIQPPAVSWGSLLKESQDLVTVADRPWQLIPGVFVVVAVLMFNFIGDGLRDAADPYS